MINKRLTISQTKLIILYHRSIRNILEENHNYSEDNIIHNNIPETLIVIEENTNEETTIHDRVDNNTDAINESVGKKILRERNKVAYFEEIDEYEDSIQNKIDEILGVDDDDDEYLPEKEIILDIPVNIAISKNSF